MKYLLLLLVLLVVPVSITSSTAGQNEKLKSDEVRACTRWMWTGDVFDRKVYCVQWVVKDCSNRLHKEICKLGS